MPELDGPLSILLVGGHPADAFDNAGGTLAHHAAAGDRVASAVMTHGVRSHSVRLIDRYRAGGTECGADELEGAIGESADEKRDEVRRACAIMGIDAAAGLIRGSSRQPHRTAQVFFMGVDPAGMPTSVLTAGQTIWCDVIVDITDVIEEKVAALDALRSQQYDGPYARKRVECVDGHYGLYSGVAYAEPFCSMRPQVYDRLPVTPHARMLAAERIGEWHARVCQLLGARIPLPEAQP